MRIIHSHGACGHTDKRFFLSQVGLARFDASSSCLRKGRATDCCISLGAIARRQGLSLLDSVYKFAAEHWMSK